jgi:hypothetical protein
MHAAYLRKSLPFLPPHQTPLPFPFLSFKNGDVCCGWAVRDIILDFIKLVLDIRYKN